ncbi:hypothetical protein L917_02940, partial [Phytophthora nicotianae]
FGLNIESGAYKVLRDILMNNTFQKVLDYRFHIRREETNKVAIFQ